MFVNGCHMKYYYFNKLLLTKLNVQEGNIEVRSPFGSWIECRMILENMSFTFECSHELVDSGNKQRRLDVKVVSWLINL